jgi:hypothetical protein
MRQDGKNLAVLNTRVHHGGLLGTMDLPGHLTERSNGEFENTAPPSQRQAVHAVRDGTAVVFTIGNPGEADRAMARLGADHDLFLAVFPVQFVPEWHLYRVPQSPQLAVFPARSATATSEPRE